MLIYVDSVVLIYFFEGKPQNQMKAANYLSSTLAAGHRIAVSDLTRLECRVGPIKLGDAAALALFDGFFARPEVQLLSLNAAVYDRATHIRAKDKFKLGDSLHLAAAVEHGCDRFATNDLQLSKFPNIAVEILT